MCMTFGLECKYGSKCVQVKTSQTRSHHDDDKVKCSCNDICDEDLDIGGPVCGSDHVTYKNSCSLKEAACGKQENITILAETPCSKYFKNFHSICYTYFSVLSTLKFTSQIGSPLTQKMSLVMLQENLSHCPNYLLKPFCHM